MKLETVQSVVAAMLSLNMGIAMAAPPSIGVAVAQGSFRIDSSTVTGNATLLEGATIETQQASSSMQLSGGAHINLSADSKSRIFGDHIVLEKGTGEMEKLTGFHAEARGLTIQPETSSASARVSLRGAKAVQVAALTGSFRILNSGGVLVASLRPGSALEFEQSGANNGEPWKLSGCLRAVPGHFTLTDSTTNVTVEAVGAGLDKESGNRVEIMGAMDPLGSPISGASQLIKVSQMKRIAKGCPASAVAKGAAAGAAGAAGGAAAAGAGGAAAAGAAGAAAAGATIAGISTTVIAVVGGVAAAATVGGLAAAGTLSSPVSRP
jgi:hypothetical protein